MAKSKQKRKGYEFTVGGEYRIRGASGKGAVKHFGPEKFIIPEIVEYVAGREFKEEMVGGRVVQKAVPKVVRSNILRCAQHIIQRQYLVPHMKETYDDFGGIRVCNILTKKEVWIDDTIGRDISKIDIDDMSEVELRQFHAIHDLTCVLDNYGELADMKLAVKQEYKTKAATKAAIKQQNDPEHELLQAPEDVRVLPMGGEASIEYQDLDDASVESLK